MRNLGPTALLFLTSCASSVTPTVQIGPADTVVELSLAESCDPGATDWLDVDGAFLEDGQTLLLRVQHCEGSRLHACGAMAPEEIYPGWFNVTLGASGDSECADRVERVVRVDLSSSRRTRDPGLDRVDQRAIEPTEAGGPGPRVVPIWVMGD